jgi:hypothetical protein
MESKLTKRWNIAEGRAPTAGREPARRSTRYKLTAGLINHAFNIVNWASSSSSSAY